MPLSEKTKTPVSGRYVVEGSISTPFYRVNSDEMPSTTDDMDAAFSWVIGDEVYGTYAKNNEALKNYRNDIINAKSTFKDYENNMIFVDTLTNKKSIGDQLKDLKK